MHLLGQPVNLSSCVQKDNSLGDCKGLVEVTQRVQLPLLQDMLQISISGESPQGVSLHQIPEYICMAQNLETLDTGH